MSRTVCIKEIKRVKKSEISKFEELTRSKIWQDFENVFSLDEFEYLSDRYSSVRKLVTKINTADGYVLYVAHTKNLAICSDSLLAEAIEERLRKYVACTYRDITRLAGETFSAVTITHRKVPGETNELETIKREMNFKLPQKKRGVHIFFSDDMDN